MSTPQPTTASVPLDTPIKRGEQEITEITLRKPDSGALRGANLADLLQMNVDALITVTPRISTPTLTEAEVRRMDPADLVQIGKEVAGFLLPKRLTEQSPAA